MRDKALLAAAFLLLAASRAEARSWRVELDGTGDFVDIQAAVDAAAAGDSILIGPGRFGALHEVSRFMRTHEAIVDINKPGLTFIGAGQGVTTLGPTTWYAPYAQDPCVFLGRPANSFTLRHLSLENVTYLVMSWGAVDLEDCTFWQRQIPMTCVYVGAAPARIESCSFTMRYGGYGIELSDPSSPSTIHGCTFRSSAFCEAIDAYFGVRDLTVSDCTITNGAMVLGNTSGTVTNCSFTNSNPNVQRSIIFVNGADSDLRFEDIAIDGAYSALTVDQGRLDATRLTITNITDYGLIVDRRCQLTIRDSNLLVDPGWLVYCQNSVYDAPYTIDLTGNYWGLTDAAAIAARIRDHADDPGVPATVLYQPFVGQPVSVEAVSWGELKAQFR